MAQYVYIPYLKYNNNDIYSDKTDRLGYIITDSSMESHNKYMNDLHTEYGNMNINDPMFGRSYNYLDKKYGMSSYQEAKPDSTKYNYYEIICNIKNMNGSVATSQDMIQHFFNKDMVIFVFEFDLDKIGPDAESELRFWTKDSMSINIHNEIPQNEKLKMLPTKTLRVKIDDSTFELCNGRIVDFEGPFSIAVLFEKINR